MRTNCGDTSFWLFPGPEALEWIGTKEEMMSKAPRLVADVLVTAKGKVLLVRYEDVSKYDGQQGWFLPDDFLAYGEHPLDAAVRILHEQVGLTPQNVSLGFIESFGAEAGGQWHLVFHYQVDLDEIPDVRPLSNTRSAEWFSVNSLPEAPSVAHHGWALDVIARMRKVA
jgi:ADP-ribose pyrophosphatase YjhB (NUDIX family)